MIIFLHYVFACRFVFLLFKESPTGEIACTSARSLHSFLCSFVVRLATSPAANAMQRHDKSCFESCSNSRHWISFRSWFMPGLEALSLLQAWFDMCGAMCLRPAALLFVQHAERSTELRSSWETSMQLCTSCLAIGNHCIHFTDTFASVLFNPCERESLQVTELIYFIFVHVCEGHFWKHRGRAA